MITALWVGWGEGADFYKIGQGKDAEIRGLKKEIDRVTTNKGGDK